MPDLKLSYFDFDGGRGEVARLALALGNVSFEDLRIPGEQWLSVREQYPFHAVPVLEVDGEVIAQSNGINRYVGKMTGLYPDDPLEALRCDEAMGAVEDVLHKVVPTFFIEDEDAKRAAREQLAEGPISLYLKRLDEILVAHGNEYFADGRLTVGDMKVALLTRWLRSGQLDYVPTDLADRLAPNLVAHHDRVMANPGIAAYYESRAANA